MPLHPQAQAIITGVESMGLPPFETFSLEEGRQVIATFEHRDDGVGGAEVDADGLGHGGASMS